MRIPSIGLARLFSYLKLIILWVMEFLKVERKKEYRAEWPIYYSDEDTKIITYTDIIYQNKYNIEYYHFYIGHYNVS